MFWTFEFVRKFRSYLVCESQGSSAGESDHHVGRVDNSRLSCLIIPACAHSPHLYQALHSPSTQYYIRTLSFSRCKPVTSMSTQHTYLIRSFLYRTLLQRQGRPLSLYRTFVICATAFPRHGYGCGHRAGINMARKIAYRYRRLPLFQWNKARYLQLATHHHYRRFE